MTAIEFAKEILRVCREHGVDEPILFGFRARGYAWEESDFDVLVKSDDEAYLSICEDCHYLPTLRSIDVIQDTEYLTDIFRGEVARDGIKLSDFCKANSL